LDSIFHIPQPLVPFSQERIPPFAHSMTPSVQAFVQQAPPLQAPLLHIMEDA
jgi:hypothetical protein